MTTVYYHRSSASPLLLTVVVLLLALLPHLSVSFVPQTHTIAASRTRTRPQRIAVAAAETETESETSSQHWLDVLKWDGAQPDFDVLARAQQYTSEPGYKSFTLRKIPSEYYATDYVFRGPIVGPLTRPDLLTTNNAFGIDTSFPDLERQPFGHAIDPENPFRVLYFERWKATHTGDFSLEGIPLTAPATGNRSISPVMPLSITFTPDAKIVYETLTTAVDRFEGNTMGKVAVFGLLETAGISLDNTVGNPILVLQQKVNRFFNGSGQTHSQAADVPHWWKSKAVSAEKNDM